MNNRIAHNLVVWGPQFLFFSLLFVITESQAQSSLEKTIALDINWSESWIQLHNGQSVPDFEEAVYDEKQILPQKVLQFSLNQPKDLRVSLQNAVYKPLTTPANWDRHFINSFNENIEFETGVGIMRGQFVARIAFVPIRKNAQTGQLEKLISAEVQVYSQPQAARSRSYSRSTTVSPLANGSIYKFTIDTTAVYKLDYNFLQELGVDVDNIDPRNIQIFGNGGFPHPETAGSNSPRTELNENAIQVVGEADGRFDSQDYILIYGIGPEYWTYKESEDRFYYRQNFYTQTATYFLKVGNDPGKRLSSTTPFSGPVGYTSSSYDALQHYERNELNVMEEEFALPPSGRIWLGDPFQITRSQDFVLNFKDRISSEPVNINTNFYARAFTPSNYEILANGVSIKTGTISKADNSEIYSIYAHAASNRLTFNANGNAITIRYVFDNPSTSASAWLDYISLHARANLNFTGGQMRFRDVRAIGQGGASYLINGASAVTVWEISDPYNVQVQSTTGTNPITFSANTDTLREYVVFDNSGFLVPTAVGAIPNQNLHGITMSPQLLIIAPKGFMTAAERLATHRENFSNISSLVVDIQEVYNEFSSGNPDISAIRDFAKLLYERSSGADSLRYLLLFGSGAYDYKNISTPAEDNPNHIIVYETYESFDPMTTYSTDDYFGLLDNGEGNINSPTEFLDIAVGRLPVRDASEANIVVDKIIRYETNPTTLGDWRNRLTFMSDDQDGNRHIIDAEEIANEVVANYPKYNMNKIHADAYQQSSTSGGSRYPDVNDAILTDLFKGNLVTCYLGHGGPEGLAQERIFTNANINSLENKYKLPLFVTATCSFAPYDDPTYTSAGELLLLNPQGGAIALLTTVRVVNSFSNKALTKRTFEYLLASVNGRMPTIGEVLQQAKNSPSAGNTTNSRKFVLLGDPSMTLAYPQYDVVTTAIDSQAITGTDTLRALQYVTISGEVRNSDGNRMTDFSGIVYPTVFDKVDTLQTRANDRTGIDISLVKNFPLQQKVIFKGRASVVNGQFSFSFIVPKDINYKLGYGKISYYADDGGQVDAHGAYQDILIGGTDPNAVADDEGPEVRVFMNNEDFASGGITDANPLLLAKLSDDSGINTVGNGIGHDLTGILTFIQDENEDSYVLNDFYEADLDDFTAGTVQYPLKELPDGRHIMQVKAWDVHNNLGVGETEFVVASSADIALDHVLNYPNPFTTNTEFMFEHNMPGQDLDVLIQIFTVSGKLVKSIQQKVPAIENDGYRITGIQWDGLDDFGDRIGRGVYVYKVTVRAEGAIASDSEEANRTLQSSEFQKCVILR